MVSPEYMKTFQRSQPPDADFHELSDQSLGSQSSTLARLFTPRLHCSAGMTRFCIDPILGSQLKCNIKYQRGVPSSAQERNIQ